jgi:hypothetical protein
MSQNISAELTSQKYSLPRNPQNQEIHDTSSELLMPELWTYLQISKQTG